MPDRLNKKNPTPIVNVAAKKIAQATESIEGKTAKLKTQPEKNPAAVSLGRLGGLKGGKARAEKLTTKRRKEIARNAAKARWEKS